MIEVADKHTGEAVRCEAARVYLPGFEYIVTYATPAYWKQGFVEGWWDITEALSGWKLTLLPSATIDEAIDKAVTRLKRLGVTPEKLHAEIARATQAQQVIFEKHRNTQHGAASSKHRPN